ncbi:MAG TPA: chitobiase/beta-hexosaminidase C-terminal domain-containing protein, partial [Candidatus Wallbacteria bacterium]|nr:chitobiase/beta-hexosaminidase C-terminal domain-containing protein [Candidatus Wallbacteria bacterium]
MKKINAINSLILIVLILLTSFSSGCGGGGGGSVSSPGGGAGSGPSITLEGEIDPVSLGIDVSAFSASGRSFSGAADLSRFSLVVLENKAYMDFRRSIADSAASSMSGYAYSPSFQESGDFGRLLNSGAVIASSDKINAVDGKLNYAIDIPINDNAPDATIALVDKNTGMAMLSAPLGCLPDKSFFASDSGAAAASGVSRAINYGYDNLIIKDFEINSQTTVLSMANIENNISSNINFFSSAVKKIAGENTSKNKVFSSKDSAVTNISTVKKVVGAWFKDTSSVNKFSNAVTTVNKVFNSNSVPKDNQKTLASLLKSKTSLIGGTLDCFTNCIKNDSIVKSVVNLTTSINIGGTVIDSRSSSTILNKVFSKITSKPADLNPPRLKSVTVSPSAAAAGETVTLSIKSDMPLAAEPAVYMFGRKAAVYKISDSEYAARVDLNSDDKTFSFSINPVIGMNGKTSLGVIVTTTDASKVTILQSSAIAATAAEPPAGTYDEAVKVVLATKTPGAFIRYTTDGTTPSVSVGTIYQDGILVNSNMVINAVAVLNGSQSLVMTASYRIMTPPPKVSAP